jgi:hypothetical protein
MAKLIRTATARRCQGHVAIFGWIMFLFPSICEIYELLLYRYRFIECGLLRFAELIHIRSFRVSGTLSI